MHDICAGSGDKYVYTAGAVGARVPLQQGPAYFFLSLEFQPEEARDEASSWSVVRFLGARFGRFQDFRPMHSCRPGPLNVKNFGSARL